MFVRDKNEISIDDFQFAEEKHLIGAATVHPLPRGGFFFDDNRFDFVKTVAFINPHDTQWVGLVKQRLCIILFPVAIFISEIGNREVGFLIPDQMA